METKNEKFIRLAENRFSRVIERIQHLRTLSAKNKYDWTEQDISDIFIALELKGQEIEKLFREGKARQLQPLVNSFNFSNIEENSHNTKRINFQRLAITRIEKHIFKDMNLVGSLSAKSFYDYSEFEYMQIFSRYFREVEITKAFFEVPDSSFKFIQKKESEN